VAKDIVERQISSYLLDGGELSRRKCAFEAVAGIAVANALKPIALYGYYLSAIDQRSWKKSDVMLTQKRLSGGEIIEVPKMVTLQKTAAATSQSFGPKNPHVTEHGDKSRRSGADEAVQYKLINRGDILVVSHSRPLLPRDIDFEAEVAESMGLQKDFEVVEAVRNLVPAGFVSPGSMVYHYPVDRVNEETRVKAAAADIRITANYARNASLRTDMKILSHMPFVMLDTRHGDTTISSDYPHLPEPRGHWAANFVAPLVAELDLENL